MVVGFLISALFFICTVNYVVGFLDNTTFVGWGIVDRFATMLVMPIVSLYFRSMEHEGRFARKESIWFAPALVVGGVLYFVMDKADVEGSIQSVLIE